MISSRSITLSLLAVCIFLCGLASTNGFVLRIPSAFSRKTIQVDDNFRLLSSYESSECDPPAVIGYDRISIEYCTGCRWQLRSFWIAQELLTTFNDDNLNSISLVPSTGGTFIMTLYGGDDNENKKQLWDRRVDGGFPELKQLKQLVRDQIVPSAYLGHSDTNDQQQQNKPEQEQNDDEQTRPFPSTKSTTTTETLQRVLKQQGSNGANNVVSVFYCTECLLRAAWFGQELLTTFTEEIDSFTLVPSHSSTEKSKTFTVKLNQEMIWDSHDQGRFPETKEIKQILRDVLNPSKDLGHSDNNATETVATEIEEMDSDEAEEARKYFGVL